MLDVLESLEAWRAQGKQIAVATVINTWGSAPRPVGSKLLCTPQNDIAGSVSAGCVEGAVIEESAGVLQSGTPKTLTFGVADETAWAVGLACGGTIRVHVEPFTAWAGIYGRLKSYLDTRTPLVVVSVIAADDALLGKKHIILEDGGGEGDLTLPQMEMVTAHALRLLHSGEGGTLELDTGMTLFFEVYPPVPRLLIVGAVHIADALVTMANAAGFDTIVIDPRGAFATPERFPHAHQLVQAYPHKALPQMKLDASAYVVVLTHDPKVDDPALQTALRSGARYVGALGSRRTHEKRLERLRAAGLTEDELARLHAPIGLDLGGKTPPEIAVSILAEIIQVRHAE